MFCLVIDDEADDGDDLGEVEAVCAADGVRRVGAELGVDGGGCLKGCWSGPSAKATTAENGFSEADVVDAAVGTVCPITGMSGSFVSDSLLELLLVLPALLPACFSACHKNFSSRAPE